jgi:hypothetical protein
MNCRELDDKRIHERISLILSNIKIQMLQGILLEYFSKFNQAKTKKFGKWLILSKTSFFRHTENFDFIYFFEIEKSSKEHFEFYIKNKELIDSILWNIAKDVNIYVQKFSLGNIKLHSKVFIIFYLFDRNTNIHPEAIFRINAPYWLFPIIKAKKENSKQFKYLYYHFVSSIVHELEHGAIIDKSLEDAFEDNEHVTTFIEYISAPMLVNVRHETEYIPMMQRYFETGEKGKNFFHASAFYMSLIIFIDYLLSNHRFKSSSVLVQFPRLSFNDQFEFLVKLRSLLRFQKQEFYECALECREKIYRMKNKTTFIENYQEAEKRLNLKKRFTEFT